MTKQNATSASANAALVLADGKVFWGSGIGATGETFGEICFNTAMTGYQEVLTDPSYAGQIITFTFPHIGNVGTNDEDIESATLPTLPPLAGGGRRGASGLVLREPITPPSNFRNALSFPEWLVKNKITGIAGIDTRALTRHIRLNGAQNVAIISGKGQVTSDKIEAARKKLNSMLSMNGTELASTVSASKPYEWTQPLWQSPFATCHSPLAASSLHVVAIDYGEKLNILRSLASRGVKITAVPATTSAEEILKLKPDGVFLSNGPGDPAATGEYAVPVIKKLIDANMPIFGICLGHQLLGIALGGKTEKMYQGHRGANHPIKNLQNGKVEITSQNHGFTVAEKGLPKNVKVTHKSLFDGTVAGLKVEDKPIFCVQYHPESSPGPHDSQYLFDQFIEMMKNHAQTH